MKQIFNQSKSGVPSHGRAWRLVAAGWMTVAITACGTTAQRPAPAGTPATAPEPADAPERADSADSAARGTSPESGTTGDRPAYTEADVRFMQGMITHHAQALVMTALVPERAGSEGLRLVAERIEVSQRSEIALMQNWLRERGEAVPVADTLLHRDPAGAESKRMPGMLTHEQLMRLANASGEKFDRLFLEFMIQHHEGALVMVGTLFGSAGAGQAPEIFSFANEVDSVQRMEIRRMRAMLEKRTAGAEPH